MSAFKDTYHEGDIKSEKDKIDREISAVGSHIKACADGLFLHQKTSLKKLLMEPFNISEFMIVREHYQLMVQQNDDRIADLQNTLDALNSVKSRYLLRLADMRRIKNVLFHIVDDVRPRPDILRELSDLLTNENINMHLHFHGDFAQTLLGYYMSQTDDTYLTEFLLERGLDLGLVKDDSIVRKTGQTYLHIAVNTAFPENVRYLVNYYKIHDIDLDIECENKTPLALALEKFDGDEDLKDNVDILIYGGADLRKVHDNISIPAWVMGIQRARDAANYLKMCACFNGDMGDFNILPGEIIMMIASHVWRHYDDQEWYTIKYGTKRIKY